MARPCLQPKGVADFTRQRAGGSNLLTVSMESIRDIPVAFPYPLEIDEINQEHRKISEKQGQDGATAQGMPGRAGALMPGGARKKGARRR